MNPGASGAPSTPDPGAPTAPNPAAPDPAPSTPNPSHPDPPQPDPPHPDPRGSGTGAVKVSWSAYAVAWGGGAVTVAARWPPRAAR
ncbi:hypothetical protein ACFYM2_29085 [Streptomyces sp. NPDC006711]|uniref:hypothetical protein n=1 Tax=unclassified Streptomyces TaxID=2593676 RepID=UPI0036C3B98A